MIGALLSKTERVKDAIRALNAIGIEHMVLDLSGPRPVITLDALRAVRALPAGITRIRPTPEGRQLVFATALHGCRVEWSLIERRRRRVPEVAA